MQIVTRAQWGARPPRSRSTISAGNVAIHHSGSPTEAKAGHAECAGVVRAIQRYHQDGRGWSDIAYNFLVCPHGVVFEGRGYGVRSAAQGTNDGNARYHAVCVLGHDATEQAMAAVREIIGEIRARYEGTDVKPHSAFKATSCPGDQIRAWLAAGMPVGAEPAPPPPPQAHSHPTPMLRRGSKGTWVRDLQHHLNTRGARLAEDGDFGARTDEAVRNFQRAQRITVDGVVGPVTWGRLHG
jgi:hypothetical protein